MENNNFKPFPFEQLKQKKEPEKTAVAIAYEPGEKAPKILATGKGQVAVSYTHLTLPTKRIV